MPIMESKEQVLKIDFTREKTQLIRGFAILAMIVHHCSAPEGTFWWEVALSMKICVTLFAFLVGFGYAFSRKDLASGLFRALKLLVQFWILLFAVFVPLYIIEGNELTLSLVLSNMFGLDSRLHWFSWFLYFYVFAMLIMPIVSRLVDRYGLWMLAVCIACSYGIECAIHLIPNWNENIFLQAVFDSQLNMPTAFVGYYMASRKIFSKIPVKKSYTIQIIACIIITWALLMWNNSFMGFNLLVFHVPVIIACILSLFTIYDLKYLKILLVKLGDKSMLMWFIHALFIMPFASKVWVEQVSCGSIFLRIVIITLLSYLLAVGFSLLTKPLMKKLS